jgi:predicted transcriptional regulator
MTNGYSYLREQISAKGLKLKRVAEVMRISNKSFGNKLSGTSDFTWSEVRILQETFFPEIEKDILLKKTVD